MVASLGQLNICFIGAGAMAEAIVRGMLKQRQTRPDRVVMLNRGNRERQTVLADTYGVRTGTMQDSEAACSSAGVLVLAMKPKDAADALRSVRSFIRPEQLVVSVVAGLSIDQIQALLRAAVPVVRTMPNTSCTIGLGATGISFSREVDEDSRKLAHQMFESVGIVRIVDESLLNIVTGVSGSGPAYVYYLLESIIAAGIEGGLTEDEARSLAVQTAIGAASMVDTTGESPESLRRKVTSPNGTTQAALTILNEHRFGEGVRRAVLRAAERAEEMSRDISEQHR